jgi:DNA-binding CsgD family transcriptional regulator
MSEQRNNKVMTKEYLAERDLRIFKMRQAGVAVAEIARRFDMSSSSVNRAVQRQLEKLNREALMAYPEVLRMELERLDNLQAAIWPLTQHRKVKMDDGTEVAVEPDLKAIQQVLSIMDRRTKLLGM